MTHINGVTEIARHAILNIWTPFFIIFLCSAFVAVIIAILGLILNIKKPDLRVLHIGIAIALLLVVLNVFIFGFLSLVNVEFTNTYIYEVSLNDDCSYNLFNETYEIVEELGDNKYMVKFKE